MIDIDAWPAVVKLSFVMVPVVVCFSGVAMNVYITLSRDYKIACSSITSNPDIESLKVLWGGSSFKWRYLLICAIGWLVAFPGLKLRRGRLDADELKAFPPDLKRRLVMSLWLTMIGFGWMAVVVLLIKLSRME